MKIGVKFVLTKFYATELDISECLNIYFMLPNLTISCQKKWSNKMFSTKITHFDRPLCCFYRNSQSVWHPLTNETPEQLINSIHTMKKCKQNIGGKIGARRSEKHSALS